MIFSFFAGVHNLKPRFESVVCDPLRCFSLHLLKQARSVKRESAAVLILKSVREHESGDTR